MQFYPKLNVLFGLGMAVQRQAQPWALMLILIRLSCSYYIVFILSCSVSAFGIQSIAFSLVTCLE